MDSNGITSDLNTTIWVIMMSKKMEDSVLLLPSDPPFTQLIMFVCTYEAQLSNINRTHEELTGTLEPRGAVVAIRSNYGHKVAPGFERLIKKPKQQERQALETSVHVIRRRRKLQGNGTCFNSALEPVLVPEFSADMPERVRAIITQKPDKEYAVKSFPTTGKTQVPGVLSPTLEDGAYIARLWAKYLTESGVGINPELPIEVISENAIMQNYKFQLNRRDPRILFNLSAFADIIGKSNDPIPPFPIREIKYAQDTQNISFKFSIGFKKKVVKKATKKREQTESIEMIPRKIRINAFYRGKINILGSVSHECAETIYDFLSQFVLKYWYDIVLLQPLPDK